MSTRKLVQRVGVTSLVLLSCSVAARTISMEQGTGLSEAWRKPLVGEARRVTYAELGPHTWYALTTHPTDKSKMAFCALRNSSRSAQPLVASLYASEDGGATWTMARNVSLGDYTSEVDCRFDRNGSLLFSFSVSMTRAGATSSEAKARNYGIVSSSDNMGKSWSDSRPLHYLDAVVLIPDTGAARGHLVVVDDTDFGTYHSAPENTLQFAGPRRIVGLDHLMDGEHRWIADGGRLPNGAIGILLIDPSKDAFRPSRIVIARIDPEGNPLPAKLIGVLTRGDLPAKWDRPEATSMRRFPAMASDPDTLRRGWTYVVWYDRVRGRKRILLATSKDGGETWGRPRVIDDSPARSRWRRGGGAVTPSIAVNRAGTIGVQWAENDGQCWRFAASEDGGVSFSASSPINRCGKGQKQPPKVAGYLRILSRAPTGAQLSGAYSDPITVNVTNWEPYRYNRRAFGLAVNADDSFQSVFTGGGGDRDQIFTTRIAREDPLLILERCAQSRSGQPKAWLEYTSVKYSRDLGEIEVGAVAVAMRSPNELRPLVLSVGTAVSDYGKVMLVNPDRLSANGERGWVFAHGSYSDLPRGSAVAEAYRGVSGRFAFSRPRTMTLKIIGDIEGGRRRNQSFSVARVTGRFNYVCS